MNNSNLAQAKIRSNYEMKENLLELPPQTGTQLSLSELEARRTTAAFVPASKFGLEAICGASCEVGAM